MRQSLANAIGLSGGERLTKSGLRPSPEPACRKSPLQALSGIWASYAVPARPIDPFVIGITVSASTGDRNDFRSTDLPLPTTRHDRAFSGGMRGRINAVGGDGDKLFLR